MALFAPRWCMKVLYAEERVKQGIDDGPNQTGAAEISFSHYCSGY